MKPESLVGAVGRDKKMIDAANNYGVSFSRHNLQRVFAAVNSWQSGYTNVLRGAGRFFRFHQIKLSRKAARVFPPLAPRRPTSMGLHNDDV